MLKICHPLAEEKINFDFVLVYDLKKEGRRTTKTWQLMIQEREGGQVREER